MVIMLLLALVGLVAVFYGQSKIEYSEELSYMFIFFGIIFFLTGILYFAKKELDFYIGAVLSSVYIFAMSAVMARSVFISTKEVVRFKYQLFQKR